MKSPREKWEDEKSPTIQWLKKQLINVTGTEIMIIYLVSPQRNEVPPRASLQRRKPEKEIEMVTFVDEIMNLRTVIR